MSSFTLDERTRLSIELALTAANVDPKLLEHQEASARQLGLTGAEIDAARRGWSFDMQTSVAVALAMASNTQEQVRQRERALRAGLTEEACCEIERLANRAAAPPSGKVQTSV